MLKIYKYPLPILDEVIIRMPKGAYILTVRVQFNEAFVYAVIDTEEKEEERYFQVFGTGTEVAAKSGKLEYRGTVLLSNGARVYHVFERVSAWY